VWDTSTRPWTFKSFEHVDPRNFQFDIATKKELRLRVDGDTEGQALPPGVFLVHYPRVRSGVKLRGGIARLAAVNWFFKTTTVTDWLAFAEVYGMPIRIGRYNPATATDDEIATLHTALINLGHDASALLPQGMDLTIEDARRPPSGDNLFAGIVNYFDEQTSRAVLGQVLASDARATGLGTAIADLHAQVRQDIREGDALAIRHTVNHLIRMWTVLNYGPTAPVPQLSINIKPPKDLAQFTTAVLPWYVQGGLEIPKEWLYETLQIPMPESGDELVKAPLAPGTPGAGAPVAGIKSTKTKQRVAAK
jgi:phage gp29-like protein